MALINCPNCGKNISDRAVACPHCGKKMGINSNSINKQPPSTGKSNNGLKGLIGVLLILVVVLLGWLYYNHVEQQRAEEERLRNEAIAEKENLEKERQALLAAQALQDSIDAAKAAEKARQDSLKHVHESTVNMYLNKVREFRNTDDGDGGDYFLYDITHDGVPELWMEGGYGCSSMYVFTYNKGGLKQIYEGAGGHASYHLGKGYVIEHIAHMGYAAWIKLTYHGGKVKSQTIYEEEDIQDSNDYRQPPEPETITRSLYDENPIISMF